MFEKFDLQSSIIEYLNKITDILYVGILWIICSIPIFTTRPATASLYYVLVKTIRHKRGTIKTEFFNSFKHNFRQGIILNLIYGIYGFIIIVLIINHTNLFHEIGKYYYLLFMIILFPFLWTTVYIDAVLSRYQSSILKLLQYSVIISVEHPIVTIILIITRVLSMTICFYFPITLVFIPAVSTYWSSFLIEKIFHKYLPQDHGNNSEQLLWYYEEL